MIDGDVFERARRDARTDRVAWILDDGYTAVAAGIWPGRSANSFSIASTPP
jgi:hypothetical protein